MLETLVPPLQRGLLYAGVILLGGAVAWRAFVAPGAAERLVSGVGGRVPELGAIEVRVARAAAWASLLLLPVWGLRLYVQLLGFRDPFAPLAEDLAFLVGETFWGTVWMAQGALLALLALGFWLAARRPPEPVAARIPWGDPTPATPLPWRWRLLAAGVVALVATLALSSHAMSVPGNRPLAVVLDGAHTLAAGAWIGALAFVLGTARAGGRSGAMAPAATEAALGAPATRSASPENASLFAAQLHGFSPVAMVSVGVLIFAGVILSTQHVMAWENLWGSPYGRMLSLKVALAGGVFLLGAVNWRRGLPVLDTPEGAASVRRRAWLEVAAAAAVLAATAVLTGMSMPEGTH